MISNAWFHRIKAAQRDLMALIGEGVASYLGMSQPASTGLIAALAYLGPRGTEVLFQRWFSKKVA